MHLKNIANLGDNVLQLNFMRRACLENRWLAFDYYCKLEYHPALLDFVDSEWSDQIWLHSLNIVLVDILDTWIAAPCHGGFYHRHPLNRDYPRFYVDFFNMLARKLGFTSPVKDPQDVLLHHPCFATGSDRAFVDILVLDCPAKSGQFHFVPTEWADAVQWWRSQGKLVATVNGMGLSLKEIGQLAVSAKHVVGVGTGPLHTAFNTVSAKTVESWHIFDHCHDYCYNDRVVMHHHGADLLGISQWRY